MCALFVVRFGARGVKAEPFLLLLLLLLLLLFLLHYFCFCCCCCRPLELLAPGPRLSKATEATLAGYCGSAVNARGDKRFVRTERLPPEEFCFDAAQVKGRFLPLCCSTRRCSSDGGGQEDDLTLLP